MAQNGSRSKDSIATCCACYMPILLTEEYKSGMQYIMDESGVQEIQRLLIHLECLMEKLEEQDSPFNTEE